MKPRRSVKFQFTHECHPNPYSNLINFLIWKYTNILLSAYLHYVCSCMHHQFMHHFHATHVVCIHSWYYIIYAYIRTWYIKTSMITRAPTNFKGSFRAGETHKYKMILQALFLGSTPQLFFVFFVPCKMYYNLATKLRCRPGTEARKTCVYQGPGTNRIINGGL